MVKSPFDIIYVEGRQGIMKESSNWRVESLHGVEIVVVQFFGSGKDLDVSWPLLGQCGLFLRSNTFQYQSGGRERGHSVIEVNLEDRETSLCLRN